MEYLVAIDTFDTWVHEFKQSPLVADRITVPTADFEARIARIQAAAADLLAEEARDAERPLAQALTNLSTMAADAGKKVKLQKMDVYDQLDTLRIQGVEMIRRLRVGRALSFDLDRAPELDELVREIAGGTNAIHLLRGGEIVGTVSAPGEPTQYPVRHPAPS